MQGWILLGILLGSATAWAQDIDIDNLSLDDLLNMKTSVASKT